MSAAVRELVLVDGSNARRSTWPNPTPTQFVDALEAWAEREHPAAEVVVVFDGRSGVAGTERVAVVDVGYADDELVARVAAAASDGRAVRVATSDRELAARVRDAGGEVAWGGGRLLRELGLARRPRSGR